MHRDFCSEWDFYQIFHSWSCWLCWTCPLPSVTCGGHFKKEVGCACKYIQPSCSLCFCLRCCLLWFTPCCEELELAAVPTGSLPTSFQHCLLIKSQRLQRCLIFCVWQPPPSASSFQVQCFLGLTALNWCLCTWNIQILYSEQMYHKWQVVRKFIRCSFGWCLGRVLCEAAGLGVSVNMKQD